LRYSPLCAANWARWNGGVDNLQYWIQTKNGNQAPGTSGQAPDYTTMVDGTQLARVCISSSFGRHQRVDCGAFCCLSSPPSVR
jgi:hypothetical protein